MSETLSSGTPPITTLANGRCTSVLCAKNPLLAQQKDVADLVGRSAITSQRAKVLLSTLDRLVAEMERGQSAVVCNSLRTFSTKVQQFAVQGILAQSDAELLINRTADLSLILGCQQKQNVLGQ